MTMVPQFSVPEIFVDEAAQDDNALTPFDGAGLGPPSVGSSAPSSPMMTGAMTPPSGSEAGDLGARSLPPLRTHFSRGSIQLSPTNSPTAMHFHSGAPSPTATRFPHHGPTLSQSSISDDWQLAQALSRPASRDGPGEGPSSSPYRGHGRTLSTRDIADEAEGRSRAGSSVSAQDVLEVLDNSAWGESIRKSFSMRRPSGDGNGKRRS